MKKIITFITLFIGVIGLQSQSLYIDNIYDGRQIRVLLVNSIYQADVVVFRESNRTLSSVKSDARWYISRNYKPGDVRIIYVRSELQADLRVFYTSSRHQAKWINKRLKF